MFSQEQLLLYGKRVPIFFIFATIGLSGGVTPNAVTSELPFMINTLPEGRALYGTLVVTTLLCR